MGPQLPRTGKVSPPRMGFLLRGSCWRLEGAPVDGGERMRPLRDMRAPIVVRRRPAATNREALRRDTSKILVRAALDQLNGDRKGAVRALLRACVSLAGEVCGEAETGSLCAQLAGAAWRAATLNEARKDHIFRTIPQEDAEA